MTIRHAPRPRVPDMDLPVTPRHIDQGVPRAASCCPIALAIQDRYPCAWIDHHQCGVAKVPAKARGIIMKPDPSVTEWIDNYDRHGPNAVQPATLHIRNNLQRHGPPGNHPVLSLTIPPPAAPDTAMTAATA